MPAHAGAPVNRGVGKSVDAPLVPGRFGQALNAAIAALSIDGDDAYVEPPLTVECWTKLNSKTEFNILVTNEVKTSGTHWELFTCVQSGVLSAYLPGYQPENIHSNADIADGRWHHVAMVFDGRLVRLYADGKQVAQRPVARRTGAPPRRRGPLMLGTVESLGCDGLIDEVRISNIARPISAVPTAPFEADASTTGLWHLDRFNAKSAAADSSARHNPARLGPSMDELDRKSFHAGAAPMDSPADLVSLAEGTLEQPAGPVVLSLDGPWEMAAGGQQAQRLSGPWSDAVAATVPGSVHAALVAAGEIPDPKFGRNDRIAHDKSFETWWFRRTFRRPAGAQQPRLVFDGVAIRCTVWLNGKLLGSHEGMFAGPEFDVAGLLQPENTLVVKIDPVAGDRRQWDHPAWHKTVVFNNVYGWHYSSIPALGIWRSVRIEGAPAVQIDHPFVAARDALAGVADLSVRLVGRSGPWAATLSGAITPDNFTGKTYHFAWPVRSTTAEKTVHLRLAIPDPRPWWPNDLGPQNLYRLTLSLVGEPRGTPDCRTTTFGLRTIAMAPLPGGPQTSKYNWTFVINQQPTFVKGAGWCTMDSSMDFSRARYDRFLSLARSQHIQMLRGWGSGMPETDDFYDLCDRKGILVLQEWPTAWNSHLEQPYAMLEETVRQNTLRLRNHPALAMWGGGNESNNPFGKAIDMMGRVSVELDGTRTFHRGEPWGGSVHNYACYWGREPLDHNLHMVAPFFGEFGLACMPCYESVQRYLPDDEKRLWPAPPDKTLAHHTPKFNTAQDLDRLLQYSHCFTKGETMERFVVGSQLSQAVGVRSTLELARTRWPRCSGALYYKLNDNYPAASWSTVDWYGAPKIGHYIMQNGFAPLHACAIFSTLNSVGKPVALPVWLLDDANALHNASWEVRIRAFDGGLRQIKAETYPGSGPIDRVAALGNFTLDAAQTATSPLLVVAEVRKDGILADRTFYWTNYEPVPDCLFNLPKTRLSLRAANGRAVVTNEGSLPAVAAAISRPGHLDTFTAEENYFWLDAGQSKTVAVSTCDGLTVEAWNAK